jgi:hypothetical protein
MSDPMTERQGNEIIRLLEKILNESKEISKDTDDLSKIAGSLKQVEKNVFDLWLKS